MNCFVHFPKIIVRKKKGHPKKYERMGKGRGRGHRVQDPNSFKKESERRNPFASQQHSHSQPQQVNPQSQHFQNQTKASARPSTNPFYVSPNKTESNYGSSNNAKIGIKANFNPFVKNDTQLHQANNMTSHQQSGSRFFSTEKFNHGNDQQSLTTNNNFRADSNINTLNNRSNPFFRSASSSSVVQNFPFSSQKDANVATSVSLEKLSNILSPQTEEITIDIAELKAAPDAGIMKVSESVPQLQYTNFDSKDVNSQRISDEKKIEKDNTTAGGTTTRTVEGIANPFASFSEIAPDNSSEYELLSKSDFKLGRIPTVAPIIS
jgi:hypothetical protein